MILPGGIKRIQGTFTDEDGNLYDPSAASIKIYDSAGVLKATKALTDCVQSGEGIWYLDYLVPEVGPTGRWTVAWTNTVATKNYAYPFGFIVWGISWPTVPEVRSYLADMGTKRLSEDTIEKQIYAAVLKIKVITAVSAEKIYNARLMCAVYLSYVAYSVEYERTAGQVPGPLLRQLAVYEELLNTAIEGIGSDIQISGLINLVELRTNTIEDNWTG